MQLRKIIIVGTMPEKRNGAANSISCQPGPQQEDGRSKTSSSGNIIT